MHIQTFENFSEKRTRRVLSLAVDGTYYWVNSQTPIEAVLASDPGDMPEELSMVRNGSFDFTIHKETMSTALWAVEFDGPTHDVEQRVRQDITKNRICGKANLPLLRIGYREDDDFLTAVERLSPLEWLVRRWITYERTIGKMVSDNERWIAGLTAEQRRGLTFEEASAEYQFDLENPYPPLATIVDRLLKDYGIKVDFTTEGTASATVEPRWLVIAPWGGPLPDLEDRGFHARSECEVELVPAADPRGESVFKARGEYTARFAYPVRSGQRQPFDLVHPATGQVDLVVSAPPWGGSPARIGGEIAWYRALKQVEDWARNNLKA